ncbi:MAG TPA: Crp/Fnr family transcriptional regulator [Chloroflexota bacterium]|nr:Crp/Fnr family transcriptional regulator [Chloroflexota bacterium]
MHTPTPQSIAASDPTLAALRRSPLLCELSDEEFGRLIDRARRHTLAHGAVLWPGHDADKPLYVVASGRLGLYLCSPGGQEMLVDTVANGGLSRGALFTMKALVDRTTLYRIPWAHLRALLVVHPSAYAYLTETLECRLQKVCIQLERVAWYSVTARLALTLLDLAQASADRRVMATHAELAAMIGSRRDDVTRALKKLRDRGLIATQRHQTGITISRPDRLAALPDKDK